MAKRGNNRKLAEIFFEVADIYQLKKVRWKPQAYRLAAQTLESLYVDVSEIYKKEGAKGIDNLPGIGEGMTKKIIEYLKTGKINEFERLKKSLPMGLYKMMQVPGIGPKKASMFYYKKGIKNVKELKQAAKQGKLIGLPGFKKRAEEKVVEGIKIFKRSKGRISYEDAKKIANPIVRSLKRLSEVKQLVVGGSFRRKKPTIRDIDIIILSNKPESVISKFVKLKFVDKVLGKGKEKATIITKKGMQVDIRIFSRDEFGAGLLYFTGDKQHNIYLRKIAIKKSWKLNEYGLFEKNKKIAGSSEKEIYRKLGLKYINPEKRIGEGR